MKRGDAFSDIFSAVSSINFVIPGTGIIPLAVCDLQKDRISDFHNVRIDVMLPDLQGKITDTSIITLSLRHGNSSPPSGSPTAQDIIGPIDDTGIPITGANGAWKILQTVGDEYITTMGNKVYSLGYVGNKRYIQLVFEIAGAGEPVLETFTMWALIVGLYAHAGKGYERYEILGIDGGQQK